jgi:hypothetical protein
MAMAEVVEEEEVEWEGQWDAVSEGQQAMWVVNSNWVEEPVRWGEVLQCTVLARTVRGCTGRIWLDL